MVKKENLLIVAPWMRKYVEIDETILQKKYKVKKIIVSEYVDSNKIKSFFKIINLIFWSDLVYFWFATNYRIFILCKIFFKKTIVVAGGYDVATLPEINYGKTLRDSSIYKEVKLMLEKSDLVIAVSESTKKEVLKISTPKKLYVIYLGVETDKYTPKTKEKIVITIGGIMNQTIKKKGLETFVKTATYLPDTKFILVGKSYDLESLKYLKSIASENVEFTGFIEENKLLDLIGKTKVYVQVSAHEAFGLSLAEAMSAGCIPVVTDRAALPEVVGNTGYYVKYDNPNETAEKIKIALDQNGKSSPRARIISKFTIARREKKLLSVLEEIT